MVRAGVSWRVIAGAATAQRVMLTAGERTEKVALMKPGCGSLVSQLPN